MFFKWHGGEMSANRVLKSWNEDLAGMDINFHAAYAANDLTINYREFKLSCKESVNAAFFRPRIDQRLDVCQG